MAAPDRNGMLVVRPSWDEGRRSSIQAGMSELVSFPVETYALGDSGLCGAEEVKCTTN